MNFLDYKVINQQPIDSIENNEKYLRHLKLTGRHGYYSQGYFGENAIVAVVDTGVDPNHPELKGKVIDMLNYSGYGKGLDDNFHGTWCASAIAGTNVGVAPKAKIVSVKVLDAMGGGSSANTVFTNISKALEDLALWTKNGKRINVISMSLSTKQGTLSSIVDKRFHNAIKNLTDVGIAVVCSAGNSGKVEDRLPACYQEPITVSAVDIDELKPASFITQNKEVDLTQCGVNMLGAWKDGSYAVLSGTSMSTPLVAGISCLLVDKFYQLFKENIPEEVLYWMLKINTKDIDIKGVDIKTGAGFCSLQPIVMDLYTRNGNKYMTNNQKRIDLLAPVSVVPPGVTSLPSRVYIEDCFGGDVAWSEETKFARFRV